MKDIILAAISDLVTNFLYYDRKEDEELAVGDIENSVKSGEISIDEMVAEFRKNLEQGLNKK